MSLGLMVLCVVASAAIFCSPPVLPGYRSLMRFRGLLCKNFNSDSEIKKENIQGSEIKRRVMSHRSDF